MEFDYALLAKYLINELSQEELEEVMKWRSLSMRMKLFFLKCSGCVFHGMLQNMQIMNGSISL